MAWSDVVDGAAGRSLTRRLAEWRRRTTDDGPREALHRALTHGEKALGAQREHGAVCSPLRDIVRARGSVAVVPRGTRTETPFPRAAFVMAHRSGWSSDESGISLQRH